MTFKYLIFFKIVFALTFLTTTITLWAICYIPFNYTMEEVSSCPPIFMLILIVSIMSASYNTHVYEKNNRINNKG